MTGSDRGVSLAGAIDPNTTEFIRYEVGSDATIENFTVRIYPGAGFALRLRPKVVKSENNAYPLIRTRGKNYIDGDDEKYEWDLSEPVEQGDEIVVEAENLASESEYNFRANADIDERGGTLSWFGGDS